MKSAEEQLKEFIIRNEFNVYQAAKTLGVRDATVKKILNGGKLRYSTLLRIQERMKCHGLSLKIEELNLVGFQFKRLSPVESKICDRLMAIKSSSKIRYKGYIKIIGEILEIPKLEDNV